MAKEFKTTEVKTIQELMNILNEYKMEKSYDYINTYSTDDGSGIRIVSDNLIHDIIIK